MGDQEVEEKDISADLHSPLIYPLPEEIQKMERTETVCCYCGVSYLIFHEFHQLRTQLAQVEAELQDLRETAQKEKAQRDALELGRLEWERALRLEMQRQAEVRERNTREELEERNQNAVRALRDEFEAKSESTRKEVEEERRKIYKEKESRVRGELERRSDEREKVLRDALQKANKNSDELRKELQQLEERLAITAAKKEEAEQILGKEKQQVEIHRGACVRQHQALRATLSLLRSSGSALTDVRGFLSQLTRAWQAFRSQIMQHNTQVYSALSEELKNSSVALQNMREEKECLSQQLIEQKRRSEEQLSQLEDSEKEHRVKLLRLQVELEEKHERWLSCQLRCDAMQKQLLSCSQREEQMNQKYFAAAEEVTQLRRALENTEQETRELKKERDVMLESHGRALNMMKEDFTQQLATKLTAALEEQRSQSSLHLREQMEKLRREMDLELTVDREKSQFMLLQCQRDRSQLQQKLEKSEMKLRELQEVLQQEWRSREDKKRTQCEERRRKEEEIHRQAMANLVQAKAAIKLMTEKNAELQEEVTLLEDTVRRECQEREELTAALSQARQELLGLRSQASHQDTLKLSLPDHLERHTPTGNKNVHEHSQARAPLTRSLASPSRLRPSPTCTDKGRGREQAGGGNLESWSSGRVLVGEKQKEVTLPKLKTSCTVSVVKRKVNLVMGRKETL
ncbi:leucine-, glutamate- and lysine-rich protein 1 isoform X1 [Neolamprologus brichardi]|uniref:leucine-, glutamate- and lysine-rich protein 1 isoform X1 n=2 Tax=Neolamprologus brichardi TaxID=32507 RepID=UPI0003EBDE22|nr:leucine-, glutamate- and lysine-rich protein 1 isoform X1 [Neolamprologus brichardi]